MKKTLVWILVIALLAVASVLGTVAYLTDVDSEENVFTIGNIDIDLLEYERIDTETANDAAKVKPFDDDEGAGRNSLLPAVIDKDFNYTPGDTYVDWTQDAVEWQQQNDEDGYTSPIWDPAKINNEVDKMVFLKNTGDYGAYVRIYFAFEAGNFDTFNEFREMIHLNLNETGDWKWEWIPFLATNDEGGKYFIANATYKKELLPDDFTDITLSQIALDSSATNEHVAAFGDTYEVFVNAQGIQSAGFKDPDTALDEGFGRDIPFEKLTLVAGIDLKTALHNLNGDGSKPITSKVATVTFGLNETYPNIVKDNVGTFTSVEQDVPVYTYYVPNETDNTKYDVYVLADSAIYTPKDSTALFMDMTALTKVDTANMDVSRTELMKNMFRDCSALTDLNVSNWNTQKVQTLSGAFWACSSLAELDVSGWSTDNVTSMYCLFYLCDDIEGLEVDGWNVSKVTNMAYMFQRCTSLTSLNVSSWNVGSVTNMSNMFTGCTALETLDVSKWDVSKVVDFQWFIACFEVDKPMNIKSLDVSNWNTGSATNMSFMFYNCKELKSLAVSKWNVSNVTTLANMFEKCKALETLDVSNWNVSNVENMGALFSNCEKLTELDLNGWNTAKVGSMGYMFNGCSALTTIYVGDNWDMTGVTESAAMFSGCSALVGGNGTKLIKDGDGNAIVDKTYARIDTPEAPGYLTYKQYVPETPEA